MTTVKSLLQRTHYKSPLGWIKITGDESGIVEVAFMSRPLNRCPAPAPALLRRCAKELQEYFRGERTRFSIPVRLEGSHFQTLVWNKLRDVGYAKKISYKELAAAVGVPRAARAVGGALNKNKIAVVVPCHRVVGRDGSLTGYASGIRKKRRLLNHERLVLDQKRKA